MNDLASRTPFEPTFRILLIEDNAADIRLTREIFTECARPLFIDVISDGEAALPFLKKYPPYQKAERPDLIFLDLNLPKKNGREVLREIKMDPDIQRIPVIVLTTSGAERDIQEVYSLHANCYIQKPMNLDEFVRVVHTVESFWIHTARLPSLRTHG